MNSEAMFEPIRSPLGRVIEHNNFDRFENKISQMQVYRTEAKAKIQIMNLFKNQIALKYTDGFFSIKFMMSSFEYRNLASRSDASPEVVCSTKGWVHRVNIQMIENKNLLEMFEN